MILCHHKKQNLLSAIAITVFLCSTLNATVPLRSSLAKLLVAYPDHIKTITQDSVVWTDNTCMPLNISDVYKSAHKKLNEPSLADQLEQSCYIPGKPTSAPQNDPGRIRYEPFFRKMYGDSPQEVEQHLEKVTWMPKVFGQNARILPVTRINDVHTKIQKISDELEKLVELHPEYIDFLSNPAGTFNWRMIANTNRLSNHSFGMTLDINAALSHYWQWDLKAENLPVNEETPLTYRNTIPWEIVAIFEKHGFIWGGKWYHYDTMHFEYRPELMADQND